MLFCEYKIIHYLRPSKTWFYGLLRDILQHSNGDYSLAGYFEFLTVEIHWCTGSPRDGPHLEVHSPPRRTSYYQVSTDEQYIYNGSIRLWFEDFTSVKNNYTTSRDACWRVKDGVPLCSGKRQDSPRLVISTPVLLILEAPEDLDTKSSSNLKVLPPWIFPPSLTPSTITKSEAKRKGITYDLIGLGFFSEKYKHFIARYADRESSEVYTYDSMKNNGNAISDPEPDSATPIQVASRLQADIPPTYAPSLAIYHLRGGAVAQQAFYQSQTTVCGKRFNLQFSTTELSTLPDVEYCGQECPIPLDPGQPHKQKGLKEYVSKKRLETTASGRRLGNSEAPTDNNLNSVSLEALSPAAWAPIVDGPESEEDTVPLRHLHEKPTGQLKINPKLEITHSPDLDSPPDSPFNIKCRCGLIGNGNLYYDEKEGEAVMCSECGHWSHVACQRNGRASKLRAKEAFFCDICQVHAPGMGKSKKDCAVERRCVFMFFVFISGK